MFFLNFILRFFILKKKYNFLSKLNIFKCYKPIIATLAIESNLTYIKNFQNTYTKYTKHTKNHTNRLFNFLIVIIMTIVKDISKKKNVTILLMKPN